MKNFLLLFLLLFSCSTNITYQNYSAKLKKTYKIFEKKLSYIPQKSLSYHDYTIISSSSYIYIYKNNKLMNKFGGIGFSKNNFSELSDFTISSSGKIIVLDGLQKEIKFFDIHGGWLNTLTLDDFVYPKLFDISYSGEYYIYDDQRKNISIIRTTQTKSEFSFDIDLENPVSLIISDNFLIVSNYNQSEVFYTSGQYYRTFSKQVQIAKNNIFFKNTYFISDKTKDDKIFTNLFPIKIFFIKNDYLNVISQSNNISVLQLIYE